jgi:hypothetical protein
MSGPIYMAGHACACARAYSRYALRRLLLLQHLHALLETVCDTKLSTAKGQMSDAIYKHEQPMTSAKCSRTTEYATVVELQGNQ